MRACHAGRCALSMSMVPQRRALGTATVALRSPFRFTLPLGQKKAAAGKGPAAPAGPAFEEKLDITKAAPVNLLKGALRQRVPTALAYGLYAHSLSTLPPPGYHVQRVWTQSIKRMISTRRGYFNSSTRSLC